MSQSAIEIFFSYVHEDEALRDKLAKHLQVLQREGIIKVWHDRKITAGEDWKNKIDRHLESANIILLLISSDFLNSDYHYDIELKRALERHESKEARVIPVILRAVDLRGSPFEKLSALPENGKAITSWDNEDEAFTNVVKGLRQFIDCFPADPDSRIGANPYKGLSAFEEADGDQFFGRKPQIKELWEKFCGFYEKDSATRLLTIYGPSGSGKSSLAMAGLIYELDQRPLPDRKLARVAVLKPNTHPLESLKLALERIAPNDHIFVKKIRDQSLTDLNADGVHDGLRQIADTLTEIEISPLIVLVDQLEDVFTLCEKPQDRDAFIGNLLCAAANRSKRVSVIVTLRSDFLGAVQKYPELDRLIQPQGFFVAAMTVDGLREAITEPAKLAGHPLDLSTVNLLIEQTSGREGTLPLLQFALTRIWEELAKKEKPKEPAETLKAIGGVGGALAGEAQRIYKSLTPNEQEIARRVFLGLVQLGEGTKDTRRRIKLEQLIHQDEQVQKVIDQFASRDTRLITLADGNGAKTVEVTHEALFDNWQQLKDWLNDDAARKDLRFQRRLDNAVMVWQEHGRPEGNLWRSPDLDLLLRHHKKHGNDMTPLQIEFLIASKQSIKWRKIKAISPYCIFGSFVTLCLFLIKDITDIEYITAKMQNKHTFFVVKPAFKGDKRNNYYYDLLHLVLREAYPGKQIEIKTRKIEVEQGEKTNALNRGEIDIKNKENRIKIDIDWMMRNDDRNKLAKNIEFPLTLGLLSHRLCLINSNNKEFSKIFNEYDKNSFIKNIRVTQVKYWPDVNFLKRNSKIRLQETESYDESIEQLLNNKANCFLRGLSEIYAEKEQLEAKYKEKFSISSNFFFQYYSPVNFYVAKRNSVLQDAIDKALIKTLESGQLLCVYKHHYSKSIEKAELKESSKIALDDSGEIPQYYLDFGKDYASIFKDVEKEEKKQLSSSECDSLITDLRKRRKQLE
jgi:TIR domain